MAKGSQLHWNFISNDNGLEMYELKNEKETLVTLNINTFTHTAKVDCINGRRNFKIEKEGFLRNKTSIKNEYGVEIGQLHEPAWFTNEGFIELNNEKFNFCVQNSPVSEVIIYTQSKKKPLLVCSLQIENNSTAAYFNNHHEMDINSGLLMALCWFLFMPIAKENIEIYAH